MDTHNAAARAAGRAVDQRPQPRRPGRPSSYDPDIAAELCRLIACGYKRDEIITFPNMPGAATIWRWRRNIPAFRIAHARAREWAAERIAEQGVMAAMNATPETAAAARLAFDAARWAAARLDPARWSTNAAANAAARDPAAAARKAAVRAEIIAALQGMARPLYG